MTLHLKNSTKTIIAMLWAMLAGRVLSSTNEEFKQIFDFSKNDNTAMPPSTIVLESNEFKLTNYAKDEKKYILTKNLSDETSGMIVTEITESMDFWLYSDFILACLYTEVEESRIKNKMYALSPCIVDKNEKGIMIIFEETNNQEALFVRIKQAKEKSENWKEAEKIKLSIGLMERILNRMVYQLYVDDCIADTNKNTKYIKRELEKKGLKNTTAYALLNKELVYKKDGDNTELFDKYDLNASRINKLVDTYYKVGEKKNKDMMDEMKIDFLKEINRFIKKIESRQETYNEKTLEDLKKDLIEDAMNYVNVFTDEKLDSNMSISKEELKNEVEVEVEVKDKLVEAVDRCPLFSHGKISVKDLRKEIKGDIILFDSIKNPRIEFNPSIGEEMPKYSEKDKDQAVKANKMLTRILCSGKIKLDINIEELKKETTEWNEYLVDIQVRAIEKLRAFKESENVLREYIKTTDINTITEFKKYRSIEYATYKYIVKIHKIFENRVKRIMDILKEQKYDADLQRQNYTEKNKEIISILADISIENSSTSEQKTHDKQKACITSILSEIEDIFRDDSMKYNITNQIIQDKKQKILDLVFKKNNMHENKDIVEIEDTIREIVEGIIYVLIDRILDRITNYIYSYDIDKVKNEITREKKCIDSRIVELNSIFEFISKSNGVSITANNYCFSPDLITSMKDIFSSTAEDVAKWTLSDISMDKLDTFATILSELNIICIGKGLLKLYDELLINPAFLVIENQDSDLSNGKKKAYIYYRADDSDDILSKKFIKLTDKNITAFKNARTAQDIKQIEEDS